jgi:hypothetical protein
VLSGSKHTDDLDDSLPLKLLADIREAWGNRNLSEGTAGLLQKLKALTGSPWSDSSFTARQLAQMLKPFGITSCQVRIGSSTMKGYRRGDFKDAFHRYLPSLGEAAETNETIRSIFEDPEDRAAETDEERFVSRRCGKPA